MNTQRWRKQTDGWLADHRHVARSVKDEKAALDKARQNIEAAAEAQKRLQQLAEEMQTQAHAQIAGVITRCLSAVFDQPYEFKIDFVQKRGRTEAELKFLKDGNEVDPLDASGGGCVDLCSFACRLACLMLARPQKRKLLVMDEPFKHLSANYVPAAKQLIKTLSEEMGFQFLIVTHEQELATGKVIQL